MDDDEVSVRRLPKAVFFILMVTVTFGFAEKCFWAISKMFLREQIEYTTDEVVMIMHTVNMLKFLVQPVGSLFVDSINNKLIIIAICHVIELIALIPVVGISHPRWRSMGAYAFYAFFTVDIFTSMISGGAQGSFNGDQFKFPDQRPIFIKFLQLDYIFTNVAVLSGMFIGPQLKTEFACFNEQDCYIIGYGLSLLFRVIAFIILVSGLAFYIYRKVEQRVAPHVLRCIGNGMVNSIKNRKTNPKPHWLDHAEPQYGAQLVADIKRVFQIMIVFSVVPIYQGVHTQIHTKWFFQASRLNGKVGNALIIPEHSQMLNPLLSIILIPLIMRFLDPYIFRSKMDRPFRRMIFGGLMVALAFVCAGVLEMMIRRDAPNPVPKGTAIVSAVNGFDCISLVTLEDRQLTLNPFGKFNDENFKIDRIKSVPIKIAGSCFESVESTIHIVPQQAVLVFIKNSSGVATVEHSFHQIDRSESGLPILTVIGADTGEPLHVLDSKDVKLHFNPRKILDTDLDKSRSIELLPDTYELYQDGKQVLSFQARQGGVYLALVTGGSGTVYTVTEPYAWHMAWIIPQNIIIIFGEVYFGIAMNEFAYLEAPMSLKAFIQALYSFSMALGELLVIIVTWFSNMEQYQQFFMSAVAIFLDMALLLIIGLRFRSTTPELAVI